MQTNPAGTRDSRPHWVVALCIIVILCATHCSDGTGQCQGQCPPDAIGEGSSGIVFVREADGSSDVMWVRLSDGSETALTATRKRNERWPYWSNAAKRLVFQGEPLGGGNSDLLLWAPDTDVVVPLRESDRRDERWPSWSPDGEKLAYAFRDEARAGIALEAVRGGATQLLAISGKKDFFFRPSFSPDGSKLVAQRRDPNGAGSKLWILVPKQVPKPLTDDPRFFDMKPFFTRHGDLVAFSRRSQDSERRDIAIISPATGETRILASLPGADDHSARPSPTRDEIAFSSDRDGSYGLFLTDLTGQSVRALTSFSDRDVFAPRWSPDGEHLALTVVEDEAKTISKTHIVVIDRSGQILLDVPGAMPDWMPAW